VTSEAAVLSSAPRDRTVKQSSSVRIAVIGCGAIAATYHLPALARHASLLKQVVLVDSDVSRARALAATLSGARVAESYERVWDDLDAAIIATPPWLHAQIAMPLLARGIHVLCEKPLAESAADARAMIEQAERSGAYLCVNHTRRAFPALRRVKELLDSGAIGECMAIEHTEGARFAWPSASGWHFARANGVKGVLFDQGAHVLDTICWWLGEKPAVVTCSTDSFGGPEGVASLVLERGACTIKVRLSWLSNLPNTYRIVGTRGAIVGAVFDWRRLTITDRGRRRHLKVGAGPSDYTEFGNLIIDNFLDAIRGRAAPLVRAAAALPSIELIEDCYRCASRMRMPWLEILPSPVARRLPASS
jgi:predicted dehydrogenase